MAEAEESFQLYAVEESNGVRHSLLQAPRNLPSCFITGESSPVSDAFNILMADVSGSMGWVWPKVVEGWQEHVASKLTGSIKMYVFSNEVTLQREGSAELTQEDFLSGGTDITSAVQTIRQEVDDCSESYVRIFIITDGEHNAGGEGPEEEIKQMTPPPGKTVEVFLLGIGDGFPVNISIDIRSCIHNGSANLPSLFWAKSDEDVDEQMCAIGAELNAALVSLALNHKGYILPGHDATSSIHLREWMYFTEPPEKLESWMLKVGDEEPKSLTVKKGHLSLGVLLDCVFRQWNSVLIQLHRKKLQVPHDTFDLMDSLFKNMHEDMKKGMCDKKDIKSRLNNKRIKTYEVEYATLMNRSKTVIGIEGKYLSEMELAENILKTTVKNTKFDVRNLKMKGHSLSDYETDMQAFKELYLKSKQAIQDLPAPTQEDCCRVTITSTLQDLQDPNFPMMFEESKFDLLKLFTMTGIAVYAPVRDASQINPWTFVIKHILVTPFTILSQQVLEASAEADSDNVGNEDKDVVLQKDNEKTRFNAIIPIVPANTASTLKPIVRSNIYAMLATFCILKNPHIIDHNAHIAALASAWVNTVAEFPPDGRPEFASERLKNILATANIYVDRSGIARYLKALVSHPKQALMTESIEEFDKQTLKCESLVKPLFFVYLIKDSLSAEQKVSLLKITVAEFIGRCLSSYKMDDADATPFTDFFAAELNDPERKKNWLEKQSQDITSKFEAAHSSLLQDFFTLDNLLFSLKKHIASEVLTLGETVTTSVALAANMEKVKKLKNLGSCGDVSWATFKPWAQEMGIPDVDIEATCDPVEVAVYISEALLNRNSRDRLSKEPQSAEDTSKVVKQKVLQENVRTLKASLQKEVQNIVVQKWREEYLELHKSLAMPMTQDEIVETAQTKGIKVTVETFNKVYRYADKLKLLRNACQIPLCPHYLVPHNNFNQHLSIEREKENFPHSLHLVSYEYSNEGLTGVIKRVTTGTKTGTNERRQPPIPDSSAIDYLREQVEILLDEYKTNKRKKTDDPGEETNQPKEDENEEFYDCSSG